MLIFLHISKTGGTTIIPVVDWNYNNQTYKISLHRNVQTFIDLPDAEKQQYQALIGQVYFGIHNDIPEPCQYVTILRNPIERLVSHFDYLAVRREKLGEQQQDISMEYFLEVEPFQAYSQINLIAGGNTIYDALKQPLTDTTLAHAKANIDNHFPIVGLIEKYDESLMLMKYHFGWKRAFYRRANVNSKRRKFRDFPKETQQLIERACELEMELYEYAQKRLDDQLVQQNEQFWDDVADLKKNNQRFSQLYKIASPLQGTMIWDISKRILRTLQGN